MISHKDSITINRPADEVADYVFDPSTMAQWSAVVQEVEPFRQRSRQAWKVGDRLRSNVNILGRRVALDGEVEEYDPENRRATLRIAPIRGNGSTIRNEVVVEDLGETSVLHFVTHVDLSPAVAERFSSNIILRKLDQTARYGLANIKDILEGQAEQEVQDISRIVAEEFPPAEPFDRQS
jgi:carbon monoxide dehydrogenase subunit G